MSGYLRKLAEQKIDHQRRRRTARMLAKHALAKLGKKNPYDGPDLPDVADAPSSEPVDPPKAPKAFQPKKVNFGNQSFSGATDGSIQNQ